MEKNNVKNSVIEELNRFISAYYNDKSIADYIFDIFSIKSGGNIIDEVSYQKFFKVLNYLQRMSGDHNICFNAGRYFAANRLFSESRITGIRFSVNRAFKNLHKVLAEIFPACDFSLDFKGRNRLELTAARTDSNVTPDFFFSEFVRGIISYIPNYWELPSADVVVDSYPFKLEQLFSDIDFLYQKKDSGFFAFDKKIAEERHVSDPSVKPSEGDFLQRTTRDIYIKYISVKSGIILNSSELKMNIRWVSRKLIVKTLFFLSLSAGAGALALSFHLKIPVIPEVLGSLFIAYSALVMLIFSLASRRVMKKQYNKIETDLIFELARQKSDISETIENASARLQSVEDMMKITKRLIQDENIVSLFDNIRKLTAKALNADRTTVFIHDRETKELRSGPELSEEKLEFRIPEDRGIAGEIFKLRKIVNIKDAYNNPNFNKTVDRQTGYRTKTILGAPLIDLEDNLIGVIQVLNKADGEFRELDEQILESLSTYIAIALKNIMTIHKLRLQGIDPEMTKGLSSIITYIFYGYQTIENELNILDIPSINSLKPMIKDLTGLMEKMQFLFDENIHVSENKITIEKLVDTFKIQVEEYKKNKIINYSSYSSITEPVLYSDAELLGKAASSILINCIEAIREQGEITTFIYNYAEIPNSLMHEYALQNIIESFNKYSSENSHGLINYIQNRKPLLQKDFDIIVESMKEFIAIEFHDTGENIPKELKNRIFLPFFSTKNHFGLGLAVARTAVNKIGGSIEEPRIDDKGKKIRVLIPLKREPAVK